MYIIQINFNIEQFLFLEGYDIEDRVSRRKTGILNKGRFF